MRFAGKARRADSTTARRLPRSGAAAARRRLLATARRRLEAFEAKNRHQAHLHGLTLTMVTYMEEHWCVPGAGDQFARWWPVVRDYATALATDDFTGHGALKRLNRLLNRNQMQPSRL